MASPSKSLRLIAIPVFLLGIALTLWTARMSQIRERQRSAAEFNAESQALARAVEREMTLFTSVLASLGELHTLSDAITPTDFAEFADKGLAHQKAILGPFGFAQRIPLSLRTALERPILDPAPQGATPAADRPEYFPLTYQNPENGLHLPLGLDLATLPGQLRAIQKMAQTHAPALGAPVADPDPNAPPGFFISAPIEQNGTLSGFTLAILWPRALLNRALSQTRAHHMQVTFFDPTFGTPPPAADAPHIAENPVAVADQPWILRCEATPDYAPTQPLHSAPLLILIGGLTATLLLTLLLAILSNRARAIERTVRERTAQLEYANRQLADEMDERARLEEAMHDATQKEKQRIGQDLHDSLGQKLTGAVYLARALASPADPDTPQQADKLIDILKDAIAQVRRTARGLAPLEVGEDSLASGLRRLAEETCAVFNIACSFQNEAPPESLTPAAAVHLYHIAQESVNNAIRHGHAKEIAIHLTPHTLTIRDNGSGFDPATTHNGAGLRIMRHRATRIPATLTLTSAKTGTTINLAW